jgi:phosphoribosylamine--glycine ligase
MTKVLLIGGGAREHAMAKAAARDDIELFAYMGNMNPGIAALSKAYVVGDVLDVRSTVEFAKRHGAELAMVGPEAPLGEGVTDALESVGVRVASPSRGAARIETSKEFMRELMMRHRCRGQIEHHIFTDVEEMKAFVKGYDEDIAVKPVGLTGGKGVKVVGDQLKNKDEVIQYAASVIGQSMGGSAKVILEECVHGEEFTLQALTDGGTIIPMPAVQDHKRAYEGDVGPNTGGMGSYSQQDHLLPFMTKKEYERGIDIMKDVLVALKKEGCPYKGPMYGQFMLTAEGPKLIEINARFGDPEAMNVLPLLESSYIAVCEAMVAGTLSKCKCSFTKKATVCKYVVPQGYGVKSKVGVEVKVDAKAISREGAELFYASVNEKDGKVYTTSSRSLGIVGMANDLRTAEATCERALVHVGGDVFVRHDIGRPEAIDRKVRHMETVRKGGK